MLSEEDLQKLIIKHSRRLQKLEEKKATFGYNTPAEILTEIEDIKLELKRLQGESESRPPWPATLPWKDHYHQLPERDVVLTNIVEHLIQQEERWGVFISGLGGIGKTATAIEIGRRCLAAGAFERVLGDSAKLEFLVDGRVTQADDRATLDFEGFLNELGTQLGRHDVYAQSLTEKRHTLSYLLNKSEYLVIIDNLETTHNAEQIVREFSQLLGPSRAIITSRQVVTSNTVPMTLVGLSETDSLRFLRDDAEHRHCTNIVRASKAKLREIHQLVGGQPLAMKLIVGRAINFKLDKVLESLQEKKGDIYRFIYSSSWEKLLPAARRILMHLGALPAPVSLEELEFDLVEDDESDFTVSDDDLMEAIEQLITLSLANVMQIEGEIYYAIHPMTRQFVNSDLPALWSQTDVT